MICACSRVSYTQERHVFHVLVYQGLAYVCMAEEVSQPLQPITPQYVMPTRRMTLPISPHALDCLIWHVQP